MQNNYDVKASGDATTVTTVPHQRMHEAENKRATENTSLSPNNNQTYFADERVPVPEIASVSGHCILCMIYRQLLGIII